MLLLHARYIDDDDDDVDNNGQVSINSEIVFSHPPQLMVSLSGASILPLLLLLLLLHILVLLLRRPLLSDIHFWLKELVVELLLSHRISHCRAVEDL